ncbi:MAG TPA: hypothetical protein VN700_02890 [Vicinamibacterales bacterium]|nr:hypothetical protein [Vicinamibacterales bacterium]
MAWLIALLCIAAASCSRGASPDAPAAIPTPQQTPSPTPAAVAPVQIEMKNVRLHVAEGIMLDIASLRGEMVSRKPNQAPVFDDQNSYVLHVFSGDISMDMASLGHLMNDVLFKYDGSPLSDITVEVDEGRLKQKAKLHKGVPIPISMKASVSVTEDGRLRLQTEKVSALGVPAKSLMELFGLELDNVVNLKNRRGIEIDGNDVILSPGQIVPPPEIRGRLASVAIVGDRLVQGFGTPGAETRPIPPPPDPKAPNYIYFSGSTITFGRLTMRPAELQLIDSDPKDPFDFFASRYERQLVAGYSKNTPSGGLKTYMPDYGDLKR